VSPKSGSSFASGVKAAAKEGGHGDIDVVEATVSTAWIEKTSAIVTRMRTGFCWRTVVWSDSER
jgi:hypothetical protein